MDTSSVTEQDKTRMCCDCKVKPAKPQRNAKKPFYRCEECHRAYKREEMRRIRARKKELVQDDPVHGMKRCTKCQKLKYYSAFSTHKNSLTGELNKICDACLTKLYLNNKKNADGMTPEWWRARAYAVNNSVRNREARKLGIPTSSFPVTDLKWICRPNDLVALYIAQEEKCCYCGVQLTKANLGVDHKTALGQGGQHVADNLCLCCQDCNTLKLDRSYEEFVQFIQEYANRIISRYNL